MGDEIHVDPDIRRAWTLPAEVYTDPDHYAAQIERVFGPSWQLVPAAERVRSAGNVLPFTLLDGSLAEPLVLTRDAEERLHCLSNVCTHRGNLVVESEGATRGLRCRYHGRRFGLDGRFVSCPEFEAACDFPSETDHLAPLPLGSWGPLVFASLSPAYSFEEWIAPVRSRIDGLYSVELALDPASTRAYELAAHWALYCDNYLEGFHIPFVHEDLSRVIDYGSYSTETSAWGSLQTGIGKDDEDAFDLPAGHPDAGQRVAAYYFWLFPNLMLNFYPWGLSVNVVEPLAIDRTRVRYLSYVGDPALRGRGAGGDLHRVEMEDEAVVENVQKGIRSRLYRRGRFSPTREQGVHHFHRLLAECARARS